MEELEEAFAEGAHRESEPSVKVSGEYNVFAFLRLWLNLPFGRDPGDHAVSDLSSSAQSVNISLGDVRAFPGTPRVAVIFFGLHLALERRRDFTEPRAGTFSSHDL